MSRLLPLQISSSDAAQVLTPEQKRFNALTRQIEQARQTLAAWENNATVYRQATAQTLLPLQSELLAALRRWVFALNVALRQGRWSRVERDTLRDLLCETAAELLNAHGEDDDLKALYDEHAEIGFDTVRQQRLADLKSRMQELTGVDLGDDADIRSGADLLDRLEQEYRAREEAARTADETGETKDFQNLHQAMAGSHRKTAAQQRKEDAAQREAEQAKLSVREVFRRLASALHPDRETDPKQRAAKTALMQQVNQAYAANDLLTLLTLQHQVEQVAGRHIAHASGPRLKHYNKVLAEQLAEVRADIAHARSGLAMEFGLESRAPLKQRRLDQLIDQHVHHLHAKLCRVQLDIHMLSDRAATKRWVRLQRQERPGQGAADVDFF